MHVFIKTFFGKQITPRGVGYDGRGNGEAGALLEDLLLGGAIVVEYGEESPYDLVNASRMLFDVVDGDCVDLTIELSMSGKC